LNSIVRPEHGTHYTSTVVRRGRDAHPSAAVSFSCVVLVWIPFADPALARPLLRRRLMHDLLIPGIAVADKLVRTVVVYGFLLVGLRLAGKRELSQVNAFDLVVLSNAAVPRLRATCAKWPGV